MGTTIKAPSSNRNQSDDEMLKIAKKMTDAYSQIIDLCSSFDELLSETLPPVPKGRCHRLADRLRSKSKGGTGGTITEAQGNDNGGTGKR